MAWDWVAPTATAATGIVAVVTTYLTGRDGRQTQAKEAAEQRAHDMALLVRRERLDIFAAFLVSFDAFTRQLMAARIALRKRVDAPPSESFPEADALVERSRDVTTQLANVVLVGSEAVSTAAGHLVDACLKDVRSLLQREEGPVTHLDHTRALLDAMRMDGAYEG